MKRCSTCHRYKDLSEFFKNARQPSGYANVCKSCTRDYTRRWRSANPDRAREMSRNNKAQQREREGDEVTQEKWREWYRNNAKARRKYEKKYRGRNPEKVIAQNAVNYALRSGALVRPDKCSKCGESCKPDAHHPNYKQKLRVVWLCKKCHRKLQK